MIKAFPQSTGALNRIGLLQAMPLFCEEGPRRLSPSRSAAMNSAKEAFVEELRAPFARSRNSINETSAKMRKSSRNLVDKTVAALVLGPTRWSREPTLAPEGAVRPRSTEPERPDSLPRRSTRTFFLCRSGWSMKHEIRRGQLTLRPMGHIVPTSSSDLWFHKGKRRAPRCMRVPSLHEGIISQWGAPEARPDSESRVKRPFAPPEPRTRVMFFTPSTGTPENKAGLGRTIPWGPSSTPPEDIAQPEIRLIRPNQLHTHRPRPWSPDWAGNDDSAERRAVLASRRLLHRRRAHYRAAPRSMPARSQAACYGHRRKPGRGPQRADQ